MQTRLMAQQKQADGSKRYTSFLHALVTIPREEGLRAMWKGLTPRLMRIPPGQAIVWAVSDQITGLASRGVPVSLCCLHVHWAAPDLTGSCVMFTADTVRATARLRIACNQPRLLRAQRHWRAEESRRQRSGSQGHTLGIAHSSVCCKQADNDAVGK